MATDDATASQLQNYGFTVVRLGFMWSGFNPRPGEFNQTYIDIIKTTVGRLARHGVYSLLNVQMDGLSSKFCAYDGVPLWWIDKAQTPEHAFPWPLSGNCSTPGAFPTDIITEASVSAYQDLFDNSNGMLDDFSSFWEHAAEQFKDMPEIIGYDLINEPMCGNFYKDPSLLLPGIAGKKNLQKLYDTVAAAIRKHDERHILFYEPVTWGMILNSNLTGSGFEHVPGGDAYRNRSAYSYHYYCHDYVQNMPDHPIVQKVVCDRGVAPDIYESVQRELNRIGGAAMQTEGMQCNSNSSECVDNMNALDQRLFSWIDWNFEMDDGTPGRQLQASRWARTTAHAVAGVPLNQSFDSRTKDFDFCFRIDAAIQAPTEIFASNKYNYPHSFVVSTSDNIVHTTAGDLIFVAPASNNTDGDVACVHIAPKIDPAWTTRPLSNLKTDDSFFLPDDMLMLRPYEQSRLGGAPPPTCPPHCAPPIPRYNEVNCTFQLMKPLSTTEHIEDFNRSGSYVCAPLSAVAKAGGGKGKLLLFFTGTSPSDNTLYMQTAATLGFHAIALSYNNEGAPNGQCSDYPTNQTIINDDCEFDVEEERLFGGNRSAVLWKKRTEPNQLVDAANSIMSRTELLLKFAATHGLAGSKSWSAFLSSDSSVKTAVRGTPVPPSGQAMKWSRIVLSGWSRGSAYPVHITKYFAAPRLVLFCGLEDYVGNRGPDSRPEPYIYQMKGLTPPENIFGVGGLHGGCCSNWMRNWGKAGLTLPGQSFADAKKDGAVNATTLHGVEDTVKGARRVYLQGPKVGHGTPIYDAQIPRDKSGRPVYTPVWEYLLTTKMAPGIGTIPEEIHRAAASMRE